MDATAQTWDLRALLAVLRRRRRWIVGIALLSVAVATALTLIATPVYRSRVEILVEPDVANTDPDRLNRVAFLEQELQTQLRLLQSEAIALRVAERLSLGGGPAALLGQVNAAVLPDTRVLQLVASDADPNRASELAQTFAEEYLDYRRENAVEQLVEASAVLRERMQETRARLDGIDAELEGAEGTRQLALRDERDTVADELAQLDFQLARLEAADPVSRGSGAIIQEARVPSRPAEPNPSRAIVVALVLGLGLGTVVALAVDTIDDALHTSDDVGRAGDRPVLGRVPLAGEDEGGELPVLRAPASVPAEAFRDLRTSLRYVGDRGAPRIVLVTSSIQGEGKSVISANLALAAASASVDVVLVDADLRRPGLARMFGLPNGLGVSDILSGGADVEGTVVTVSDTSLSLLVAGQRPPNPSELLASAAMDELIRSLAAVHELVIVDSPPVLVVPDALEVAGIADATLLVAELGRTTRREVGEAVERIERVGGRVSGLVVNRSDLDPSRYGYYYDDDRIA